MGWCYSLSRGFTDYMEAVTPVLGPKDGKVRRHRHEMALYYIKQHISISSHFENDPFMIPHARFLALVL